MASDSIHRFTPMHYEVSTKATLSITLKAVKTCVPSAVIDELKASSNYYKSRSDKVVIQSDEPRKQNLNRERAF